MAARPVNAPDLRGFGETPGFLRGATGVVAVRVSGNTAGDVPVDQVQVAIHAALTSPASLRVDGVDLPIAQLVPPAAKAKIKAVVDVLTWWPR